jgi:plasmid stability protein
MGRPLQIREVPEDVLRVLRVRAAEEGTSLSGYVLRLLEEHAAHPTIRDVISRPRSGWATATREDVLAAVREGRQEQEEKVEDLVERRSGR